MPLYRAVCHCGHAEDVFRAVKDYNDLPHHCGQQMTRAVCAPAVIADIQPYRSMATGEFIEGRSQHRDHLKRHGLVEVGNETPKPYEGPKLGDIKKDLAEACHRVLG